MTEKDLIIQDLRRENAELRARVPQCGMTITNADRIRSMTDEELKKFICSMFKCEFCDFELGERCGLLNWLKMPAEDDE